MTQHIAQTLNKTMKMKPYRIIYFFLILILCISINSCQEKYKLYIGKISVDKTPISIWINDDLVFNDTFIPAINSTSPNFMSISNFNKKQKQTFIIKYGGRDTIFTYETDTISELNIWIPSSPYEFFFVFDDKSQDLSGIPDLD